MGAWIEISSALKIFLFQLVAPFVGAWIEILREVLQCENVVSLPSWERGLKSYASGGYPAQSIVAPFVGAWIEIAGECETFSVNSVLKGLL